MMFVESDVEVLRGLINAPHIRVQYMALGGHERASLYLAVGLDAKDTWNNGIFENSRYIRVSINQNGIMEQFSGGYKIPKKFRKCQASSLQDAANRINKYVATHI